MANIKDLKVRIKSTKGTLKITSAMKLVSAAKMARAQNAVLSARPYARELDQTIRTVSALVKNYSHSYLEEREESKHSILLVVSSNKGLCGGYNSQLNKAVQKFIAEKKEEEIKVYFAGKKLYDLLHKKVNTAKLIKFEKLEPSLEEIRALGNQFGDLFSSGEVGRVYIAYNAFQSAISFDSSVTQLLPMTLSEQEKNKLKEEYPFDFKYDPSPEKILDELIPETFINTIHTCFLDALAAEHGARMAAMDKATKSCKDMVRSLTLKKNKLRQAAITTELIEVVSGAEALNA